MMKSTREFRLTDDARGVTFQDAPHEFLRAEVYPDYFGLTWSTRWSPRDYVACAKHVLTDEANGKRPPKLLHATRSAAPRAETEHLEEVLDSLQFAPEPASFVKLDAHSKILDDMSLSWLAKLPSNRLVGPAVGFVGKKVSRSYIRKLILESATEEVKAQADDIVEDIFRRIPAELRSDDEH